MVGREIPGVSQENQDGRQLPPSFEFRRKRFSETAAPVSSSIAMGVGFAIILLLQRSMLAYKSEEYASL